VRDDDFDISLDQTIRTVAPTIPPEAMPVHEDTPTLVVVPSALAALAERSMETAPIARPRKHREDEELALRRAVYGIWAVAAILFATLGLLIK
jgi:hypothetical protein